MLRLAKNFTFWFCNDRISVKVKGVCLMKLQAVDSQNFQSRRDRTISYNYSADRKNPRANVDAIIGLNDNAIRAIAYEKTMAAVDDKKHRKLTKAMFYSIPLVAGVASAVLSPARSKFLSKELTGISGKLMNGLKTTAMWAGVIAAVEAVSGAKSLIEKHSPEFKQANRENPFLSFVGTAAAFLGVVTLGGRYLPELTQKVMNHIKPASVTKFANSVIKKGNKFNNLEAVKTMNRWAKNLGKKDYMQPLKTVGETVLSWAPSLLLWGGVFHSINHGFVKNREFVNNYSNLKETQSNLAKARLRELSMQNDFLMQDERNREDVKVLRNNMADLPQEVVDAVKEVRASRAECPECV